MKQSIQTLQDIAFNLGYTDGLVRVAQNRGLIIAEKSATLEFAKLAKQWESAKSAYIKQFANDSQCPVMKQLVNVLLQDRHKHFNLGLKACSDSYTGPSRKTT